ncbi:hypothetical protein IW261DRAFT_1472600 [Armillaria novae-zelandiae]|uniref:F-box domain-containing protein n=1 Tax=Armillaria novae-zelandiae TaxID=153914 RepID=A0AA39PDH5_9AGAR|nr:hypothetical protein IW261DRAFT_1472600 [Armillaria novae-zelandiae]
MSLESNQYSHSTMSLLPPELWLEIFSWATMPEGTTPYECNYKPFRESPARDDRGVDLEVKALASKLSMVCRDWHAMTTELLYKDVLINRGQNALKSVLCPHQNDPGYGKMVSHSMTVTVYSLLTRCRSVVLCYPMTAPSPTTGRGNLRRLSRYSSYAAVSRFS